VSRAIDGLAENAAAALRAIDTARAAARARSWALAGKHAPDHGIDAGNPLIIDCHVGYRAQKEGAAPTFSC
jgi:hypothetical protein